MKEGKKVFLTIGSLFLLYLGIYYWKYAADLLGTLFRAAKPLLLGCVLAYIINILMVFYEKKILGRIRYLENEGRRRIVSVLLSFISVMVILGGIFYLILPELVSCVQTLVQQVPKAVENIKIPSWVNSYIPENNLDVQKELLSMLESLAGKLSSYLGTAVNWFSSLTSLIVDLFVAIVFAIYLLFGKEKLAGQMKRFGEMYVRETWLVSIRYICKTLNTSFHKFIVGQSMEAVILGTLCIAGMLILRLPFAVMVGTFIGFTALIPIVGAYLGAVVGGVMILTVSPTQAILFLIFVVVLQQIEGNLIYPKVVGASIGLPGIWVFAAITLGGGLLGIPGMLLGVPVTAAIYQMVRDDSARRRAKSETQEDERGENE